MRNVIIPDNRFLKSDIDSKILKSSSKTFVSEVLKGIGVRYQLARRLMIPHTIAPQNQKYKN
jgi:hypothetical protein